MDTGTGNITVSIYYPHSGLKELIHNCLMDLFGKLKNNDLLPDYRLSTIKGENITVFLHNVNNDKSAFYKDIIRKSVDRFFKKYPVSYKRPKLPVTHLFLDFPPNTLHFWGNSPIRNSTPLTGNPEIDRELKTLISRYCINLINESDTWGTNRIFYLFIEMIHLMSQEQGCIHPREKLIFFDEILENIFQEKSSDRDKIMFMLNKGKSIYQNNQSVFNGYLEQLSWSGNSSAKSNRWNKLFSSVNQVTSTYNLQSGIFSQSLLFECRSKLCLRLNEFVMALGVLNEYHASN